MFAALTFQERDARGDLRNHKNHQAVPPSPPPSPPIVEAPRPRVNLANHPTRANLIGGKGLFVNLHAGKH
eukprot:scaffold14454_cov207-Alexandrium_tamarense.AAC.5